MNSFICAIATNDKIHYAHTHFGDAKFYILYKIQINSAERMRIIENNTLNYKEKTHADPKKAGNVVKMLTKENTYVVVSAVYGPNIKRIKSKFVCLLVDKGKISNSIPRIVDNFNLIQQEWEAGEKREYLNLRRDT